MNGYRVAVIGAGVAGLTAAHELAERGCKVIVFDAEHDALAQASRRYRVKKGTAAADRQPIVGGLAATQWYRIPSQWGSRQDRLGPLFPLTPAAEVNLARPGDWFAVQPRPRERRLAEWERREGAMPHVPFQADSAELLPFAQQRIRGIAAGVRTLLEHGESGTLEIRAPTFTGEAPETPAARAREVKLELLVACRRRPVDVGDMQGVASGERPGRRSFWPLEVRVPEDGSGDRFSVKLAGDERGAGFDVRVVSASGAATPIAGDPRQRWVEIRVQTGGQWSEPPWEEQPEPGQDELPYSQWEARWPLLPFAPGSDTLSEFVTWRIDQIAERLKEILAAAQASESLVIGGVIAADERPELSVARARAVEGQLVAACERRGLQRATPPPEDPIATFVLRRAGTPHVIRVRVAGLGAIHARQTVRKSALQHYVEIRLLDRLLPGEHGYRFFPSFYRHVFETMHRIPLLRPGRLDAFMTGLRIEVAREVPDVEPPGEAWEVSERTVFDNLRSVELHALDSGEDASVRPMERFNTRSLRGLLAMLDSFQEHADVPLRDVLLGQLKMLRYATSCRGRRDSYEAMTWFEFAEAEVGGPQYRRLLEHWPQALVGLQASRADARTTGTILLQLLLDQVRSSGYRDGTLNAPTSEAWLDPWKRFLEQEREVEFVCARVDRFVLRDKRVTLAGTACDGDSLIDAGVIAGGFDYVVMATPADVTAEIGASLRAYLELERRDLLPAFERSPFEAVTALVPKGERYQVDADSDGPYEHFSGVQFYLDTDFAPLRGHVYYPKSPWRLSSVSQSQFRLDRPGELDGYTGVISVVIGAFDVPGRKYGPAWSCTARQIAEEVWDQITVSLKRTLEGAPLLPRYFAIDRNLIFAGPEASLSRNLTPFMVNAADQVRAFPEQPGEYEVHLGHFVFAGTYLKTRTRLVTMEAANESARHAVNAMIRHARAVGKDLGQQCPIFDPEDREPEELELLRRIDAELLGRGLPHWMDILAVEPRTLALLDRPDGGKPADLGEALVAALDATGGLGTELLRIVRALLLGRG